MIDEQLLTCLRNMGLGDLLIRADRLKENEEHYRKLRQQTEQVIREKFMLQYREKGSIA